MTTNNQDIKPKENTKIHVFKIGLFEILIYTFIVISSTMYFTDCNNSSVKLTVYNCSLENTVCV